MCFGVISKEMAPRGNFFDERWRFADILANEEKCGFGAVPVEEIEELGSDSGIRAIVKSKRKFSGTVRLIKSVAEELGARTYSAVGSKAR